MGAFSDEELEQFYRRVEALTEMTPTRRQRRPPLPPECPTPYKDAFRSEADARDGISRIRTRVLGRDSPSLRCYLCTCRSWHITSSPPRDDLPARTQSRRGRGRGSRR